MKTKALLLVLALFMCTTSAFSQEYKYFREGNLTYVQDCNEFIHSLASTKLHIQSYRSQRVEFLSAEVRDSIFRTVITKERAKELKDYRIPIFFTFDGSKEQLAYLRFTLNNNELKLKLDEMDRLEKAFKKLKYKFYFLNDERKLTDSHICFSTWIVFDKLYND